MTNEQIAKIEKIGMTFRDVVSKEIPDCGVIVMWGVIYKKTQATGIASENLSNGDLHDLFFELSGRAYGMEKQNRFKDWRKSQI